MTTDQKPNKEQVYDEQISPLMQQIIEIAQKNGIATLISFAIPTEEKPTLMCTTMLPDGDDKTPDQMKVAITALRNPEMLMLAVMAAAAEKFGGGEAEPAPQQPIH